MYIYLLHCSLFLRSSETFRTAAVSQSYRVIIEFVVIIQFLHLFSVNTTLGQRSIQYKGCVLWNLKVFVMNIPMIQPRNGYNQYFALGSTFFEAKLTRPRPGRGQMLEAEADWLRPKCWRRPLPSPPTPPLFME